MKSMWPIFKVEMLIYQLGANLDVKILFGSRSFLDPKIEKCRKEAYI